MRDADGHVSPRLEDVEAAAQQRVLAYDRAGDGHYDTVSAFIKSLRGNDPDAALYWLAAMIAAGEDPKFIARRLIISASEDVGNADPRALSVAVAAGQALDWIGLPEAQYALAQATTYIATAPKSNRSGAAYWAAVSDVEAHGALPVPLHLRNAAHRGMKQHGIGVGYRYPHDFEGADVEQQYLPDALADRRYYLPTDQGYESTIAARMAARAEARAAAKAAGKTPRERTPPPEVTHHAGDGLMKTARDEPQEARRHGETRRRRVIRCQGPRRLPHVPFDGIGSAARWWGGNRRRRACISLVRSARWIGFPPTWLERPSLRLRRTSSSAPTATSTSTRRLPARTATSPPIAVSWPNSARASAAATTGSGSDLTRLPSPTP